MLISAAMQAQLLQLRELLANDPVLLYCLAAAALLAIVSLSSGFRRADALALQNQRILVRVLGAVALAFVLRVLAEGALAAELPAPAAALLPALHRFPLYLVALAYGPTTGLLTGVLFAAFASSTLLPGAAEAVLALELAVLGWLAIYPSPRTTRWAGPLNAGLAYLLAWGTGGIAMLAVAGGDITLTRVINEHLPLAPSLGLVLLLLLVVGPRAYAKAFPHSRIAEIRPPRPAPALVDSRESVPLTAAKPLRVLDTLEFGAEPRRERRRSAFVAQGDLGSARAKRLRVRRLTARSLPEDDLTR